MCLESAPKGAVKGQGAVVEVVAVGRRSQMGVGGVRYRSGASACSRGVVGRVMRLVA